uniref:L-ascorbate oxidase n=1 Tax=Leersia perrieri TaxID=77586 RepID=A0A0D9WZC5_9ORYZ
MEAGNAVAVLLLLVAASAVLVAGDDPYRFFTWTVTYGDITPLGVKQQGILINEQFPGPQIEAVTNDNLIINVFNKLNEPFLLSWNGIQQRRNSFEDGVAGTTCPIPPGGNFTYILQVKDQIGTYFYFPSLAFHKAAGGFGAIRVLSRPMIPVPFPPPAADYPLLIGDWFKANHTDLKYMLDSGKTLGFPDGLLINGRSWDGYTFNVQQGRTYRFRISNVGLSTSLNVRFQGHTMKLVEVEGSHTMQTTYSSLDVHLGQSYSVLLTADQPAYDYAVVVSTRFTSKIISTTAVLRYANSQGKAPGSLPGGPTIQIDWSLNQARSIRWNLTASGPRPNPQGSYHYGMVTTTRTIRLANSAATINGKQRYAVNGVSYVNADTPLKIADYYKIGGVFSVGTISDSPSGGGGAYVQTAVMGASYRDYVEIVFENSENEVQSWHIDGYAFWVVGMDGGKWSSASRQSYNLRDAVSRYTVQVYPNSWTAIYMPLDNVGMWNVRSENWARQYLGQQFYLRVWTSSTSWRDEYPIPKNALLCGRAAGRRTRPL